MRRLFAAMTVFAFASPVLAADKQACIDAHSDAQHLRKADKLIDAQRALATCSASDCPSAVAQDCTTWRDEVEAAIPSIALTVRDEAGHDIVDVRVSIDGALVATHLDGRPLPLDPGEHKIRCEAGARVVETAITAHASEKARAIRVDLPLAVAAPPVQPQPLPVVPVPESPRHPLPSRSGCSEASASSRSASSRASRSTGTRASPTSRARAA